jgi:Holliday junction resolvase RusA-like endonuclease
MILTCGSKKLKFTVLGKPQAQQRPKFNSFTKRAHDPKESAEYKSNVRAMATVAVLENNWNICHREMPVSVNIISYRPIPTSVPIWKKNAAIHGLIPPLGRNADIDNVMKGILDAMNGVVYEDDCQVFKLTGESRYSDVPRVEIEVEAYFVSIGDVKAKCSELAKKNK